ncbi:MAG: penicillin-binding protein 2 [Candidatus Eisenbacteria bacterium]|uniref:Penicillin-binding protein 2 n=1 Tax=Eiseniibacteriota bacterium TaxID=2212470 RepID=A0A538TJ07_UNCEI|nr:MAG: penicillin-binding protein 2 [Candidatus Eisenbacteria bacterium]TMQ63599.1 MAG: penicillin-binding protein 2 [Candidatus Eisenbacteria bacterium]
MRAEPISLGGWQRRERILTVSVAGIFALVLMRLFFLQVLQGQRYRELSEGNRIRVEVLTAPRGEVRDRKGRLLADCVPSFTVTLDPFDKAYTRNPAHIDSTLATLGPILGVDPTLLKEKIQRERKVSFLPIRLKRNVDIKSVAFVSEHRDQLPGVEVESEPLRRYPLGLMASHLLGYVGEISDKELLDPQYGDYLSGDLIGRMGIERRYEKILRGQDGKRFLEVNALGRKAELLGDKHPIVPRRGVDLELTIDLDVQRAAEEAFAPGARGAVVALDPRNGEVLALASKPNYDPNEFSTGITQERWSELSGGGNYPLFNRAIQAAYPPGSTLKPFTSLAGLECGAIVPGTVFASSCTGEFRFGTRLFGCWNHDGHGRLSMHDAIVRSCDVYFYQLGLRIGLERLADFMSKLQLSEKTGIDLPQERRGLFPDRGWYDRRFGTGRWSRGLTLNVAIGQGEVSLTPVKLAQLAAFVGNGGVLWKPHLVRSVASGASAQAYDSLRQVVPVSPYNLEAVRSAMASVVSDPNGTGGQARLDSIAVAGKTGTAQNPHGKDHALFICFAPAEAPRIAVAVLVENAGHGSSAAAPIARKVLEAFFHPAPPESAAVMTGR